MENPWNRPALRSEPRTETFTEPRNGFSVTLSLRPIEDAEARIPQIVKEGELRDLYVRGPLDPQGRRDENGKPVRQAPRGLKCDDGRMRHPDAWMCHFYASLCAMWADENLPPPHLKTVYGWMTRMDREFLRLAAWVIGMAGEVGAGEQEEENDADPFGSISDGSGESAGTEESTPNSPSDATCSSLPSNGECGSWSASPGCSSAGSSVGAATPELVAP
jgi:hypothetical protein